MEPPGGAWVGTGTDGLRSWLAWLPSAAVTTTTVPPAGPPPPGLDLDRKLKWRLVPIVVFVATLIGLAVVAFGALRPPEPTTGLPDDPAVREAQALVRGIRIATAPYRLHSEFFGIPEYAGDAVDPARLESADSLLHLVLRRRPLDARAHAALAAVELARRRLRHAESGFRRACDLAGHYPDARIGLGVTLALRADMTPDPFEQRRLRLRAIAQLLDVRPGHPGEAVSLYDRARIAIEVERFEEARRAVARLAELEPASPATAEIERLLRDFAR